MFRILQIHFDFNINFAWIDTTLVSRKPTVHHVSFEHLKWFGLLQNDLFPVRAMVVRTGTQTNLRLTGVELAIKPAH